MKEINLKKLIGKTIQKADTTRKLTLKGETKAHPVYRIPLDLLYYNDRNGRIATYISQYITEGNLIDKSDLEQYNTVIQKFIEESNINAIKNTTKNISKIGQLVPAVVLNDGRVIDGNRRFTCLRRLKDEGKAVFLEAVILDPADGIDQRDIKRLELNLQHAEEKPVDYNPIDNLVDVYRDLKIDKLFTVKEYSENTNKSLKDVDLMLRKAELMNQYLEYMNAHEQYFIARDMELDGPLQELASIFARNFKGKDLYELNQKEYPDKQEQAEYYQMRDILFTIIFVSRSSNEKVDLSRQIRTIGKVLSTPNKDEFIKKYEEVYEEVYETLHEQEKVTPKTVKEVGKKLEKVKDKGIEIVKEQEQMVQISIAKEKPLVLISRAVKLLEDIELDQIKRLDEKTRKEFDAELSAIEKLTKKLSTRVRV